MQSLGLNIQNIEIVRQPPPRNQHKKAIIFYQVPGEQRITENYRGLLPRPLVKHGGKKNSLSWQPWKKSFIWIFPSKPFLGRDHLVFLVAPSYLNLIRFFLLKMYCISLDCNFSLNPFLPGALSHGAVPSLCPLKEVTLHPIISIIVALFS